MTSPRWQATDVACPECGAARGEACRGETHGVREDAARAWIPPREEADDEPEADRRSRERWHAAALCLGFNELAKLGRTLGEKVYHRMMRAGAEEHFIALGGQRIFQEEPTLVTLTLEDGMPWVRFRACDIELMREAVAKWDADHIDDTTGGDDA